MTPGSRFSIITLTAAAFAAAAVLLLSACHHIDNRRLPFHHANLMFWTQADWEKYGVTGAGEYKIFNKKKLIPANFNYLASSATGVGGILLVSTYAGEPIAYDMACPVECNADIVIFINEEKLAECPRCHSCYDVFMQMGAPVSGDAATEGYGLEVYTVAPGPGGEYRVIY